MRPGTEPEPPRSSAESPGGAGTRSPGRIRPPTTSRSACSAVAVAVVVELAEIAQPGLVLEFVLGPGRVAADVQVFEEAEPGVHPVGEVPPQAVCGVGAVRPHHPDGAAVQDVALQPEYREVRLRGAGGRALPAAHGDRAHVVVSEPPRDPGAPQNGDRAAVFDANAAAEEEHRRAARWAEAARGPRRRTAARTAEVEDPLPLQEELALFREEEAEPGEVDLLRVGLDLGEVGVVGEVGGEPAGDPYLGVHPEVPAEIALERPALDPGAGGVPDQVRLHLDGPGTRRRFESHQGARRADLGDRRAARAPPGPASGTTFRSSSEPPGGN